MVDRVVLAVVDVPVICSDEFLQFLFLGVEVLQLSVHRQSGRGVITVEIPQVQFLEKVVDVPVVCNVRCLFETVHKTVAVPQLPFRVGVRPVLRQGR